tara:strand:- start:390 stop:983 length:594 start_codon:yes stop_codon:yes gene_type:complete
MGTLNNQEVNKTRADTFPVSETVNLVSATSISMKCGGSNAVDYTFTSSGDNGRIEPGETIDFYTNGDPVTDTITLTYTGASNIEIAYSTGVASGGGGGGGATAANQVIIINILNGNVETLEFFEQVVAGAHTTDQCLSCSITFNGTGGTLNSINVPDGFTVAYSGTERNEVGTIGYTTPTAPDFNGFQRVLISYTKL